MGANSALLLIFSAMSWVDDKARLEALARCYDSSARLTTKDSWFWRAIGTVLPVLTVGGLSKRDFLQHYATTIGPLQAYPRDYSVSTVESLLVHEARHTYQARWFGLGLHPWLGLPAMAIAYLLLPLPLGLAYFRYRLELDADIADWRHRLSRGEHPESIRYRAREFAERVSSGNYGYAWPARWTMRSFIKAAERVIAEHHDQADGSVD
jgi:hypothetical protein